MQKNSSTPYSGVRAMVPDPGRECRERSQTGVDNVENEDGEGEQAPRAVDARVEAGVRASAWHCRIRLCCQHRATPHWSLSINYTS